MKPVSKTAYYCAGVRMLDAQSKNPLIGDQYAEQLLGADGMRYWDAFKSFTIPNGTNIARCYLIEKHLTEILSRRPDTTVILIGAGLDSRAFRFPSGRWIEIDEPAIIEYKESLLPAESCKNALQRIAIDFEKEDIKTKLAPNASHTHVVVIIEGVLLYLTREERATLLTALTHTFKRHALLCDLMNKRFYEKLVLGKPMNLKLRESGAHFKDIDSDPTQLLLKCGYSLAGRQSTVITANAFNLNKMPKLLVKTLFRRFLMGYSVYRFDYGPA